MPGTSSVTVPLSTPEACRRCHGRFDITGDAWDTWSGSAMGHAARDPLFHAALVEAELDHPGVGDFCLRCHAPRAWLEGRCMPTDGSALEDTDGGIGCSACHRMLPNPWVRNAQYIIADDSTIRGPYGNSQAPHDKVRSDWISDSRLCGTCHDVFTPGVRRRTPTGALTPYGFGEQTTYSEWAASAFATEGEGCKDCHMREETGPIAKEEAPRTDRSHHGLAGSNVFLLEAIEFLEPQLGLSTQLAFGRARIMAVLQSAATVELTAPAGLVDRGAPLPLTVRVTNLSGHKLPTGYPEGRRVWVALTIPSLGIELGAFDTATGEPVDPPALYRVVQGRAGVGPGHHLALNDTVFEDSRIPPRGFVPTATTAPVGKVFAPAPGGGLVHWDDVTITATVPCDMDVDMIEGRAQLFYQSVTKSYVDTLVAAAGAHPAGARLETAYLAVDPQPIEIARAAFHIAIEPASTCTPPDAGVWPDAGTGRGSADAGAGPHDDGDCDCAATHGSQPSLPSALAGLAIVWALIRRRRA